MERTSDGKIESFDELTYLLFRYRIEADGTLQFFGASDAIMGAIERGEIAGTISGPEYGREFRITADPEALDAFIAEEALTLFPEEEPFSFERIE